MRILLIEDDPVLGMAVRDQIVADGHGADWVTRLADAADAVAASTVAAAASPWCVGVSG